MVRRVSVAVVSEPEISVTNNSFTATSRGTPEFALPDGTPITKSMHRVLAREQGAARKREITEKCKKVYEVLDWLRNHEPAAFERVADDAIRDESYCIKLRWKRWRCRVLSWWTDGRRLHAHS